MNSMTPDDRTQFIKDVAEAIANASATSPLSDDERRWVRLAIRREAQSVTMRQAIIEKTLAGLVWAALGWVGYVLVEFLKNHGAK